MSRTTATQIRNTFISVETLAWETGVDTAGWALVEGSKTYGNAYAVVKIDPETGGRSTVMHLGFTREEAFRGLSTMAETFYLALTVAQRRSL